MGWDWECDVGKSINFCGGLRYWVRYCGFWCEWLESSDFTGFGGILDSDFYFLSLFIL